jgi:hypothetical protein
VSIPRIPDPARLVMSVLAAVRENAEAAAPLLVREFGPLYRVMGPLAFDFTSYYDREMGPGIQRWLWVFANLVDRGELARIKRVTNEVESLFLVEGKRTFNLDPGLLSLENFVLATGKNRAHRIYLGDGIFADLTLVFREESYHPLPWTYPDYADAELILMLNELRESYKCKLRQAGGKAVQLRA